MDVSLRNRVTMAWYAFWCKPFEFSIQPFHRIDLLKEKNHCDIGFGTPEACPNPDQVCMSRTVAEFSIKESEHEHLCWKHANQINGKY